MEGSRGSKESPDLSGVNIYLVGRFLFLQSSTLCDDELMAPLVDHACAHCKQQNGALSDRWGGRLHRGSGRPQRRDQGSRALSLGLHVTPMGSPVGPLQSPLPAEPVS